MAALALALPACGQEPPAPAPPAAQAARPDVGRRLDPPAVAGSLGPDLAVAGDRIYLTWLEPVTEGKGSGGHRLQVSWLQEGGWAEPVTAATGGDFFANWADFPALVEAGDGSLVTHWVAKTAAETYAYSIFLARSEDGGASWTPLGRLNDDETHTEHGFVSWIAEGDGVRAFWLDGRQMADEGPMSLRTALVGGAVEPSEVLDRKVCDCCSTDAAMTGAGPVVVFRDRTDDEIRDISVVRRGGDGWAAPRSLFADGWNIAGCPVNGPEIAAAGERVAVAWFTGADDSPKVRLAFSDDAGAGFDGPLLVDGGKALGRVDLVLDGAGGAVVTWLAAPGDQALVQVRRALADGRMGDPLTVATTGASRKSGFPRLARRGGMLYLAWVDTLPEDGARIRVRALPLAAVPVPA